MTDVLSMERESPAVRSRRGRVIGRYGGSRPGPLLLCIGGMHGNEPAGIDAIERVLEGLRSRRSVFRGTVVGLVGNIAATGQRCRFLEEDLNRLWLLERVEEIEHADDLAAEELEQAELVRAIRSELSGHNRPADWPSGDDGCPAYLMDLHTTSAPTAPFAIIGDTLRNRAFAERLHVPLILGFEEQIEGTLTEFANNLGIVTVGFEAGRHDDPEAIELHEAGIWLALHAAGNIADANEPHVHEARRRLARAVRGLPRVLEIRHRHPVDRSSRFAMRPGFVNFQQVAAGQVVADGREGEIRSPASGRMFLPLYQEQGDDGFFIARPIKPFWLRVSTLLRTLRLGKLAAALPGVERVPDEPGTFRVNSHVARVWTVEIFHLLGYRRRRTADPDHWLFTKRSNDIRPQINDRQ